MTYFERTVLQLLVMLFWRITEGHGIARWASDVKVVEDVAVKLGNQTREEADRRIKGYLDSEQSGYVR